MPRMSGDNFHFDMTGVNLALALQVAFSDHPTCVGIVSTSERLTLYWTAPPRREADDNFALLPQMTWEQIKPLIEAWQTNTAKYGKEPDHDGDNGKGLRVFNESWSHVGGDYRAFAAIEPAWIMYGK